MVVSPFTDGIGFVFTVTVSFELSLQEPLLTTTLKVLSFAGLTVILLVVAPLLHKYVPTPVVVNTVLSPIQIELLPVTLTVGVGLTVMETVVSFGQPLFTTVTVYVVSLAGLTVIVLAVAPLLQEYVPPPVAVSITLLPEQMV